MHDTSRRRIASVARHLQPDDAVTSDSGRTTQHTSSPELQAHDTAAAAPSSYARVHGAVSRKAASWTNIPAVQKQSLSEVIYEKVEGEGIAKVGQQDCPAS